MPLIYASLIAANDFAWRTAASHQELTTMVTNAFLLDEYGSTTTSKPAHCPINNSAKFPKITECKPVPLPLVKSLGTCVET